MPNQLINFKALMKRVRDWAKWLATVILIYLAAAVGMIAYFGLVEVAMWVHWALGLAAAIYMFGTTRYLGSLMFQQPRMVTEKGILLLVQELIIAIFTFSVLSYGLHNVGLAQYEGFRTQSLVERWSHTFNFIRFYVWTLFDLIPGLKINESMGWNSPPLTKSGFVSGFLVLCFRATIIFVLLKQFSDWWVKRSGPTLDENNQRRTAVAKDGREDAHNT